MAIAVVTTVDNEFLGDERVRRGRITLDTSYPTGGSAYTAALFNLNTLRQLKIHAVSSDGATLVVNDETNLKLKCFSALGTEVVNATNIAAKTVQFEAIGQ